MRGEELVRMVPWKDGKANHGHSCIKGRFAWGYATAQGAHPEADDPRKDHRSLARSLLGRGDRLRGLRVQAHPGEIRQRLRSAASPRRAAPTKKPISFRNWSAPASATTTSIPARASAIRRPAMASAKPSAPRPARRISIRSMQPTSSWSSAPTRPTRTRSSARI